MGQRVVGYHEVL